MLAIPFIGWAFHSGRGRRVAYVAYAIVFLVATLLFAATMLIDSGPDLDPIAFLFTALFSSLFVIVVALGVYGLLTRR